MGLAFLFETAAVRVALSYLPPTRPPIRPAVSAVANV